MAIKPLQTITLKNEGGDDITYTLSGEYPDLTAGAAEQIISDEYTENKVPYLLRASNFGSKREDDTLVGGTVAWNQLLSAESTTTTNNGVTFTGNGDGSYTLTNTATGTAYRNLPVGIIAGHKYYLSGGKSSSIYTVLIPQASWSGTRTDYGTGIIASCTATASGSVSIQVTNGTATGGTVVWPQIIDLTQMFGSTIADYIYALEQANAGAGVAWFKALFPADYYAYNAGELMSVSGLSEHKMVGFNAWDEVWEEGTINVSGQNATSTTAYRSKNYIPIIKGRNYYFRNGGNDTIGLRFYDADKNYIGRVGLSGSSNVLTYGTEYLPNGTAFLRFTNTTKTTYNHDICINLSSSRNGEYEPYKAMSYPLDSSLTLRGVPKLDANNSLYYDGDIYESDGTVTRKYGIVDLGSLTWGLSNGNYYAYMPSNAKAPVANGQDALCENYPVYIGNYNTFITLDKLMQVCNSSFSVQNKFVLVRDSAFSDAETFKSAMSGVYLVYELATPTTETADPYTNPQNLDPDGTEEYVSTSIVPVGHNTKYFADLVERLAAIPEPPTANGTYRLIATVSGGVATLSWVAN